MMPLPTLHRAAWLILLLVVAMLVLIPRHARAEPAQTAPQSAAPAPTPAASPAAAPAVNDDSARQYCTNIANAAADARFIRQKEALAAMEKDIDGRLAQLETKRAEYQDWLDRREAFLKKADDQLVAVMSQMRPDAAASQVSAMNEDMAAALLAKLSPRVASAILNEVEPARAARLTSTMVGLSRRMQESTKK